MSVATGKIKSSWSIDSWRKYEAKQQPNYSETSPKMVNEVFEKLQQLPPLVHPNEVDSLKAQIAEAQEGRSFILQGGDCAERFQDCMQDSIEARFKILLQMSLVLSWGARIPTVRIGRLAGQYGKPRSSDMEEVTFENGDKKELPSYKGDNINGYTADSETRRHDPNRLLLAHYHSACTLNYIRALIKGKFAALSNAATWDLGKVEDQYKRLRYQDITSKINESFHFMNACKMPEPNGISEVDFFTSHEGLVLEYESAVTRKVIPESIEQPTGWPSGRQEDHTHSYYNLGSHFLWIGNRTRALDGAHIEYFRGIANPIGIKIGSDLAKSPDQLVALIRALNPTNEPGKITLISRMGKKNTNQLPPMIDVVRKNNLLVLWSCDPMHGNTYATDNGLKTRRFDDILQELTETFHIHNQCGSRLGGVHFELTGEHVTECVGGPENLSAKDLNLRYTSFCDPRLNYLQSMEMSFLLADLLKKYTPPKLTISKL